MRISSSHLAETLHLKDDSMNSIHTSPASLFAWRLCLIEIVYLWLELLWTAAQVQILITIYYLELCMSLKNELGNLITKPNMWHCVRYYTADQPETRGIQWELSFPTHRSWHKRHCLTPFF